MFFIYSLLKIEILLRFYVLWHLILNVMMTEVIDILTEEEFVTMFEIVPNSANGNCFFESMEYLLSNLVDFGDNIPSHEEIRFMVGEFYRDFDMAIDYPEHTIEYNIKMGIMFDDIDNGVEHTKSYNLDEIGIHHVYNIYQNYVWASMTDVLVCAVLFNVNINLYKKIGDMYYLEQIKSQYSSNGFTIDLYYNGINHFEALKSNF